MAGEDTTMPDFFDSEIACSLGIGVLAQDLEQYQAMLPLIC
jgi:hypothetical protein